MVGAEDSCAGDEEVRGIVRSYEVPSDVAVGVAVIADDVSHDQLGPGAVSYTHLTLPTRKNV